jgi:fumarylacetoacetate (FAA) hydrolase
MEPLPEITSIRDFMAFEAHVRNARARRGAEVPPEWYEGPTYYHGTPHTILRHEEPLVKPDWTRKLDFELELACIIGTPGVDIAVEDAERHIAGFTIMNDWSARDVQRREMAVGLGPSKSKDFASSFGPGMVPLGDLAGVTIEPGRYDLTMVARIDGVEVSRGNAKDMNWTFSELIAHASVRSPLEAGALLASGTVGGGCLLELGPEVHAWLEPGNVVELEIERIGVLRTPITA